MDFGRELYMARLLCADSGDLHLSLSAFKRKPLRYLKVLLSTMCGHLVVESVSSC